MADIDALVAEPAWEMFFDTAYFDMWCVRRVGETNFGAGFHVPSKAEAQGLLDALEAERSTRVRLEEALRGAEIAGLRRAANIAREMGRNSWTLVPGFDRFRTREGWANRIADRIEREATPRSLSHSSSKGESRE